MERRNFIRLSALGTSSLLLVTETFLPNEKLYFNAIINHENNLPRHIISFFEKKDIRICDHVLIANGDIEERIIITSRINENTFSFLYINNPILFKGNCVALLFRRMISE